LNGEVFLSQFDAWKKLGRPEVPQAAE